MELRHLRYLLATVDHGSVTAAAAAVHVTQPSLSRQLRHLERDLGLPLLTRGPGGLTLTRTGEALVPAVRRVVAAADDLRASAGLLAEGQLGHLRIAAPVTTLTDVVSPFVAEMEPDDPTIDVQEADGLTVAEMLQRGADLAIGTNRPQPPYASRPLAVLPVLAYVRPDDPWADRGRIGLAELLTRPLVSLPSTWSAREALEAAVAATGTSYASLLEAHNGTLAQALAASGRGIAVVSDDPRFGLRSLAIDVGGEALSIHLVAGWDGRATAAPALASLAERLSQWVVRRYG